MNVIVRKNYPIEKLPADLREGLATTGEVTVTISASEGPRPLTKTEAVDLMRQMQTENRGKGVSVEEAVARIRSLRDEWDD
jgi:hypothetical protein